MELFLQTQPSVATYQESPRKWIEETGSSSLISGIQQISQFSKVRRLQWFSGPVYVLISAGCRWHRETSPWDGITVLRWWRWAEYKLSKKWRARLWVLFQYYDKPPFNPFSLPKWYLSNDQSWLDWRYKVNLRSKPLIFTCPTVLKVNCRLEPTFLV